MDFGAERLHVVAAHAYDPNVQKMSVYAACSSGTTASERIHASSHHHIQDIVTWSCCREDNLLRTPSADNCSACHEDSHRQNKHRPTLRFEGVAMNLGQLGFVTQRRFFSDEEGVATDEGGVEAAADGGEAAVGGKAAAAGDCFCLAGGSRLISFFARPGGKGPFGTPVS